MTSIFSANYLCQNLGWADEIIAYGSFNFERPSDVKVVLFNEVKFERIINTRKNFCQRNSGTDKGLKDLELHKGKIGVDCQDGFSAVGDH